MAVSGLVCRECGRRYPAEPIFVCEHCFGPLEVEYDHGDLGVETLRERIATGAISIWRYQDLLPVARVGSPRSCARTASAKRLASVNST